MAVGEFALIRDLAVVLVTAAVTALLFHKLKLPLVLGYLAAGVIIGPHVLPNIVSGGAENIELLAQLGVLFLLFSLGLDFHLAKLRRVGGLALTAGVLETALMVGMGFLVASLFGWNRVDALFLGAILAISSTTLIVKVLGDLGRSRQPTAHAIFGILLVEDLVAVLLIALLSSLGISGGVSLGSVGDLVVRVAIFILATLVLGLVIVPRAVDHVAKLRVDELLVLLAVGVAFATSMVALALGLSIALGAFIAGAIVAESRASDTVERKIAPLRDVFTAVFFVSTGILLNPADVLTYWAPILILATVSILGKIAAVSFATFVAGYPPRQAARVGIGMAMIGEFSFVIASLGADLGVTSGFLLPIAVSVSALTTLVTPPLIRHSDKIVDALGAYAPRWLRDYAATYSGWAERARRAPGEGDTLSRGYDAGALVRVASYAAVLVATGFVARYVNTYLLRNFSDRVESPVVLTLGVFVAFLLLAIPIVVGLVRAVRELVDGIVFVIVPPRQTHGRGQAAAAVLRNSLYAFLAVLVALVAVAAGSAFLPPLPLVAGAIVVVGIAGFVLRGSLKRLNKQLEQAVDAVFSSEPAPGQRDEVMSLLRQRYPWELSMQSVIVPAGSRAAHRRIRDLQLPQRTGATIVTHERDGLQSVNPPPDTLILPGDTLGVLGDTEQVEDARRDLTTDTPATPRPTNTDQGVHLEEIDVLPGSPLAGTTLAGSRIRERTGASVVGLRREGVPILNPAPVLRLQPGDTVVVLGAPAQVEAVKRLFASDEHEAA